MSSINRQAVELTAAEFAAIQTAVLEAMPSQRGAFETGVQTILVEQPFFRAFRILEVSAPGGPLVHVALAQDGEALVLTHDLPNLNRIAAADPPENLDRPDRALLYSNVCDLWTRESDDTEILVASFDEISWWEEMTTADSEFVENLRRQLGTQIQPPRVETNSESMRMHKWLLSTRNLVRREIEIGHTGWVRRTDKTLAHLPVPDDGWEVRDDRLARSPGWRRSRAAATKAANCSAVA